MPNPTNLFVVGTGDNCFRNLARPCFQLSKKGVNVTFASPNEPAEVEEVALAVNSCSTLEISFVLSNFVQVAKDDYDAMFVPHLNQISCGSPTVIYLSIHPGQYAAALAVIQERINDASSVVVALEKPFATSLKEAQALQKQIQDLPFRVIPIDHYLHKSVNAAIGPVTKSRLIRHFVPPHRIEMALVEAEPLAEGRTGSYFGALFDLGVHHLATLYEFCCALGLDYSSVFVADEMVCYQATHLGAESCQTYASVKWLTNGTCAWKDCEFVLEVGKGAGTSKKNFKQWSVTREDRDSGKSRLVFDVENSRISLLLDDLELNVCSLGNRPAHSGVLDELIREAREGPDQGCNELGGVIEVIKTLDLLASHLSQETMHEYQVESGHTLHFIRA